MAFGGGTFTVQNKVLPGTYVNFISLTRASANLSDRGVATMPLELDWGVDGKVFEVTNADFQKNSVKIFGYDYAHEKMKGLRDLFLNVNTLYAYRLNSGEKASCTYATAKHSGTRGNDLTVIISKNVNDETKYDVKLTLGTLTVDTQTVSGFGELVDNDFVVWNRETGLAVTAGEKFTGGTNGTVETAAHQTYLDKIEPYSFNVMGIVTADTTIKQLYANFVKRMREEVGSKFQVVLYGHAGDYEGVINLKNKITDEGWSEACLVYWMTGLQAACAINKSCTNKIYNGEFTVDTNYTQAQLAQAIKVGELVLHAVGAEVRVLEDVNSLVTVTDEKGEIFKDNQTIRVIDQIANEIATIFNTKYLGNVPNDESGRISLWTDIVKIHEQMDRIRAIENFTDKDITVVQGDSKKSVVVTDAVEIINTMTQLYITVRIA